MPYSPEATIPAPDKNELPIKNPILLITTLSLVLIIFISITFSAPQQKTKISRQESTINPVRQGTPAELSQEEHPSLFFTNLEYNLKANLVTQLNSGTTKGDPEQLFSQPPPPSEQKFIYKIEVLSKDGNLLQNGWRSLPKRVIQTAEDTLVFRITTSYKPGALIYLYLSDNQQIWLGKIQ